MSDTPSPEKIVHGDTDSEIGKQYPTSNENAKEALLAELHEIRAHIDDAERRLMEPEPDWRELFKLWCCVDVHFTRAYFVTLEATKLLYASTGSEYRILARGQTEYPLPGTPQESPDKPADE